MPERVPLSKRAFARKPLEMDFGSTAPDESAPAGDGPNGDHPADAEYAAAGASLPPKLTATGLFSFPLVPDGHESILLGNRYLNRGDGAIISSTSGMGKSAMCVQMATELALNRGPLGIHGNGPLRSLIVQSEDSAGDIAEMAWSIRHVLALTDEQVAQVTDRVKIVTDRIHRGATFLAELRKQIAQHKPDLVWLNPLQAFIDGDVTDSKDLGSFLREGLNSLNEPASFGYVLIHHTTKPATGKDRAERLWHEVMYDMAGGAELINWARAILSLRATPTEGQFNLVLAKRGRRAGVTKKTPQGAGFTLEPVTVIPLKHATGRIDVPGIARGLPLIFWEPREADVPEEKKRGGPAPKYKFSEFKSAFPAKTELPKRLAEIHRALQGNPPISINAFYNQVRRFVDDGQVEDIDEPGKAKTYRLVI